MKCSKWIRNPPRGEVPNKDWKDVDDRIQSMLDTKFIEAPNYLYSKYYGSSGVPWDSECELEPLKFNDVIVGIQGAVMSRSTGIVSPSLSYYWPNFYSPIGEKRVKKAVSLRQYNCSSYYHFVVEALPRLMSWNDDGESLILTDTNEFIEGYLECLGIGKSRIEPEGTLWVDELYWPTLSSLGILWRTSERTN